MPVYTSATDIYDVLSSTIVAQLTDDSAGTVVNTDYVESALDRAEGVVDSYVSKAYDVPLDTPVPGSIKHAVLTLAVCNLYKRRPGALPDEAKAACAEVTQWLIDVASGKIELNDLTAADETAESDGDDRVFDGNHPFQ